MMRAQRSSLFLAALAALAGCAGGGGGGGGSGECDLLTGDLVISEVMANPMGPDDGQEYFEIYNASSAAVDMTGVTLRYAKADGTGEKTHTMDEIVVEAGEYLVVGDVVQELKPNHVDYGYGNSLGSMLNGGATLSILCGDEVIDETEYPDMEGDEGVSFGLDGNVAPDHLLNDAVENFCPATTEFVTGLFGSPGESNEPCNIVVPGQCNDGGTMRDTVPPEVGDLVITEFLANPEGADTGAKKDWFEIYATRNVDLNGVVAGEDVGSPKVSFDDASCVSIAADEYVILAQSDDVTLNGGLPVAPVRTFTFNLVQGSASSPGTLFIGIGEDVLDQVSWSGSDEGHTSGLDPGKLDPADNDDEGNWCPAEEAYGDAGNFGSPGAENGSCPVTCDPGQCNDGGCRDVEPPTTDEVVITEVMPNPEGAEPGREWFEITAAGDFDLAGLQFGKDGTLSAMLDTAGECGAVTDGDVIVIVRNTNDDVPAPDFRSASVALSNGSTNSTVVGAGDVVLDEFVFGTSTEGKSRQLDPDGVTICNTPSTTPYTAGKTLCGGDNANPDVGNCGTPGDANPDCP